MAILSEQRTDFAGDFLGFTFNDYHSSVFGITRVSSSNRYDNNLLPTIQDKTIQTPGGDGTYYFGSYYTQKQFTLQIAFDSISEKQLRRLSEVFGDKGIHDLIFDESPYKIYSVKCTGQPQLKYICFDQFYEKDQNGTIINEVHRVYKGEGTLSFTAFYPFARSRFVNKNQIFTIQIKDLDGKISKIYNNTFKEYQEIANDGPIELQSFKAENSRQWDFDIPEDDNSEGIIEWTMQYGKVLSNIITYINTGLYDDYSKLPEQSEEDKSLLTYNKFIFSPTLQPKNNWGLKINLSKPSSNQYEFKYKISFYTDIKKIAPSGSTTNPVIKGKQVELILDFKVQLESNAITRIKNEYYINDTKVDNALRAFLGAAIVIKRNHSDSNYEYTFNDMNKDTFINAIKSLLNPNAIEPSPYNEVISIDISNPKIEFGEGESQALIDHISDIMFVKLTSNLVNEIIDPLTHITNIYVNKISYSTYQLTLLDDNKNYVGYIQNIGQLDADYKIIIQPHMDKVLQTNIDLDIHINNNLIKIQGENIDVPAELKYLILDSKTNLLIGADEQYNILPKLIFNNWITQGSFVKLHPGLNYIFIEDKGNDSIPHTIENVSITYNELYY